jgi:hypothetical protein
MTDGSDHPDTFGVTTPTENNRAVSVMDTEAAGEFHAIDNYTDVAAVDGSFSWLHKYSESCLGWLSDAFNQVMTTRLAASRARAGAIGGSPVLAGMLLLLIAFVAADVATLLLHSYAAFTIYEMSCYITSLLLVKLFSLKRIRRSVLNQIVVRRREDGMKLADGLTIISASILSYAISETGSWICVFIVSFRFILRESAYALNILILIETFSELIIAAFVVLYFVVSHAVSDNLAMKLSGPLLRGK